MSRENAAVKATEAANWLSSWLCLGRYDGVADLSLYQWGMQFAARSRVRNRWRAKSVVGPASLQELIESPLYFGRRGFRLSDRRPIEEIGHLDVGRLARLLESVTEATAHWESRYGSMSAENRAINSISAAGFPIHSSLLAAIFQSKSEIAAHAPTELPRFKDHLEIGFVGVDLRYDDTILRQQFEQWLTRVRGLLADANIPTTAPVRVTPSSEKFKPDTMSQWIRLKVLPYTDIMLVAEAQEQMMPSNEVIGRFLFPDSNVDVEALVKKQLAPKARKLMQPHNYERMLLEGQQIPGLLYLWEACED